MTAHAPTIGDMYTPRVQPSSPCYKYRDQWVLWGNDGIYDGEVVMCISKGPDTQFNRDVMKGTINLLEPA